MEVRMSRAILSPGNLSWFNPAINLPSFQLGHAFERLMHPFQRVSQLSDRAIFHGESEKQPAVLGVVMYHFRKQLMSLCFPHQRPSPLADWTSANMAKPSPCQFEFIDTLVSIRSQLELQQVCTDVNTLWVPAVPTLFVVTGDNIAIRLVLVPNFIPFR